MSTQTPPFPGVDAFNSFWTDFVSRLSSAGVAPPNPAADYLEQARRAFFDAMAKHAEEFMRSEQFLAALKQGMDNALAWQQAMNQFLQKGLAQAQMPSKSDSEHLVVLIRGMEERLLDKVDALARRIDKLEDGGEPRRNKTTRA